MSSLCSQLQLHPFFLPLDPNLGQRMLMVTASGESWVGRALLTRSHWLPRRDSASESCGPRKESRSPGCL